MPFLFYTFEKDRTQKEMFLQAVLYTEHAKVRIQDIIIMNPNFSVLVWMSATWDTCDLYTEIVSYMASGTLYPHVLHTANFN